MINQGEVMEIRNEVAVTPVNGVPVKNQESSFVEIVQSLALNPNVDVAKMQAILEMQERVLDRNSRAAFSSAFAQMQAELPEIERKGKGHNEKDYALMEDINRKVMPILKKYGFAISFRVKQEPQQVHVTAVLSHREGHQEESAITLAPDTTGSKNNVQAVGSSITYGKRYAIGAVLNITTCKDETDDDGNGADPKPTEPQLTAIKKLLMNATQKAKDQFVEKYESLENVKRGQVDKLTAWLKKNQEMKNVG